MTVKIFETDGFVVVASRIDGEDHVRVRDETEKNKIGQGIIIYEEFGEDGLELLEEAASAMELRRG